MVDENVDIGAGDRLAEVGVVAAVCIDGGGAAVGVLVDADEPVNGRKIVLDGVALGVDALAVAAVVCTDVEECHIEKAA